MRETINLGLALVHTKRPHNLNSMVTKISLHYRVEGEESVHIIPCVSG